MARLGRRNLPTRSRFAVTNRISSHPSSRPVLQSTTLPPRRTFLYARASGTSLLPPHFSTSIIHCHFLASTNNTPASCYDLSSPSDWRSQLLSDIEHLPERLPRGIAGGDQALPDCGAVEKSRHFPASVPRRPFFDSTHNKPRSLLHILRANLVHDANSQKSSSSCLS